MSDWLIVIQALGIIGMGLGIYSLQPKRRMTILKFQMASNLFWILHFTFLGATTGAALNLVGGLRAYVFNRFGSQKNRSSWLLGVIIILMLLAGYVTWQGVLSLLPITGMCIATLAFWQQNEQRIRLLLLFAAPLWLTYNVISGSFPGIANEVLAIISSAVALYRHRQQGFRRPAVQKSA